MTKAIALTLIALMIATPVMAKGKKSKPAPIPVVTTMPTPAPVDPKPSFMDQQIANALANSTRPSVGTYSAAAALQSGGVEAAEQASQGF